MAAASLEPPINPTAQALQHQQLEEDEATHSLATGLLDSQNEGHRGLLAITTIAVVASLALEFNTEEVKTTLICCHNRIGSRPQGHPTHCFDAHSKAEDR